MDEKAKAKNTVTTTVTFPREMLQELRGLAAERYADTPQGRMGVSAVVRELIAPALAKRRKARAEASA